MEKETKQKHKRKGSKELLDKKVKKERHERKEKKEKKQHHIESNGLAVKEKEQEQDQHGKVKTSLRNMSRLSQEEAIDYRKSKNIQLFSTLQSKDTTLQDDYYPLTRFSDAIPHLPPGLVQGYCANFPEPTPIQSQTWPLALDGRDVVGIAETGSGKTLAFGFPALALAATIASSSSSSSTPASAAPQKSAFPAVLILAPTRELALQIQETLLKASSCITGIQTKGPLHPVCIYGGMSKYEQAKQLYKPSAPSASPLLIVGTPGRVLDFLNDGTICLDSLRYLVLDEADRMLDLGFEPDIRRIISFAPPKTKRQTLMFSATWPTSIRKLAAEYLNDSPAHVAIGRHGTEKPSVATTDSTVQPSASSSSSAIPNGSISSLKGCATVEQIVRVVQDPFERDAMLVELLNKYQNATRSNRIIIFVLYKKEADRIESFLNARKWHVGALHGDKSQSVRCQVLESFKTGKVPLLIATDVAARGLDIPNVEVVINFSFPLTIEDYVHRIGRTGRAGQKGVSVTLFTPLDKTHSGELIQVLKNSGQPVPEALFKFGTTIKKKEHKDYGAFYKEIDPNVKASHVKFD